MLGTALTGSAAGDDRLFVRGEVNQDGAADLSDAVFLFAHLFAGGGVPGCRDAADANDDGVLDISDGIYLLGYLFQGGPAPPAPGLDAPCPGPDPTPDDLDCASGLEPSANAPALEVYPVIASAPGVRQRSRQRLPAGDGTGGYRVEEGTAFTFLVEATSNRVTRAGFALADPADPHRGNPGALRVTADRALGEPSAGGAGAGENVARLFFAEVDGWKDPIYLVEHAGLRIAGDGPLAPAPGVYHFEATVTDTACATSAPASFTLEVEPSRAPEVFAWVEAGTQPSGTPLPHDPGSGSARVRDEGFIVVIEVSPNGRAASDPGLAPDAATLRVMVEPPLGVAADLTSRFVRDLSAPARWFLRLDPGPDFPLPGNVTLSIDVGTAPATNLRRVDFVLEREISYAEDIQPIWNVNCTGCHEQPAPERGLELVRPGEDPARLWRNIVNVYAAEPDIASTAPLLIWPYYPERSYLYHKLRGTQLDSEVAGEGERMPLDSVDGLSEATLHVIESWIIQGARR